MGEVKKHPKCMRFVAAFSRHPVLLDWLWERVRATWGSTMEVSIPFPFAESAYYQSSMGQNLLKQFAVLDLDYDPTDLASQHRSWLYVSYQDRVGIHKKPRAPYLSSEWNLCRGDVGIS